jgi:cell division protein FtsX
MLRTALFVTITVVQVGAIVIIAVLWCYLSHLRQNIGPLLVSLNSRHGVHTGDLLFVGLELVLLTALIATLIAGYRQR